MDNALYIFYCAVCVERLQSGIYKHWIIEKVIYKYPAEEIDVINQMLNSNNNYKIVRVLECVRKEIERGKI